MQTLVVLHGFCQSPERLRKVAEFDMFNGFIKTITPLSPRFLAKYIFFQRNWITGDENYIVDILQDIPDKVHLAGFSDGARIAFRAAQMFPVKSLIFNAGEFRKKDIFGKLDIPSLTIKNRWDCTPTNPEDFYNWAKTFGSADLKFTNNRHQWTVETTNIVVDWIFKNS